MAFDFKKEYKEFYMPKNKPEIITVPKANAKEVARLLVDCSVQGIWNFANTDLDLDDTSRVVVENVHFADSLLALSYMISEE